MPQRFLPDRTRKYRRITGCSHTAQLLWYRAINLVDDYGRYEGDLVLLARECFVWEVFGPDEFSHVVAELTRCGAWKRYQVAGEWYIEFCDWWEKPRKISGAIRPSKYPPPPADYVEPAESVHNCSPASEQLFAGREEKRAQPRTRTLSEDEGADVDSDADRNPEDLRAQCQALFDEMDAAKETPPAPPTEATGELSPLIAAVGRLGVLPHFCGGRVRQRLEEFVGLNGGEDRAAEILNAAADAGETTLEGAIGWARRTDWKRIDDKVGNNGQKNPLTGYPQRTKGKRIVR